MYVYSNYTTDTFSEITDVSTKYSAIMNNYSKYGNSYIFIR